MTHSIKRALALILALLLAIPAFAFAEPLEDDFEIIAFEEEADVVESAEEAAAEVELDLSELEAPEDEEGDVEIEEEAADVEESSEEAALVVENPAFVQSVTMEDGMTITVKAAEGVFPDDASLSVTPVEKDLVGEVEGKVAAVYTYDIKVLSADGEELYQPKDDTLVEIIFNAPEVANDEYKTTVFHVVDEEEEIVEELVVSEAGANASVFSDHFSFYQVVFTWVNEAGDDFSTDPAMPTAIYKVNSSNVEGVLLSEILDSIAIGGGDTLADVLEDEDGNIITKDTTVTVSNGGKAYLEATKYTHFLSETSSVVVYDYVISVKKELPAGLDENIYITVSKKIGELTKSVNVYMTGATQRYVYGVTKDKYYATLKAAVDAGETHIIILDDLTETSAIELKDGNYTLDLTDRTLKLSHPLRVYRDKENYASLALLGTGGTLDAGIDLDYFATLSVEDYYDDGVTPVKLTVKGNITTANNAEVTEIQAGTYEGTLTASEIYDGTFKAAVTVDDEIYGGTFNGAVETSGDIWGGTFKGAVTLANGGEIHNDWDEEADKEIVPTFDGTVTALEGSIYGGKYKNKITETTWIHTGYVQYFKNKYWVVEDEDYVESYPIHYLVVYPTDITIPTAPETAEDTFTGVKAPEKDAYIVDSTAATTLWDAATAYTDFGTITGWYNYENYNQVLEAKALGTVQTYDAIPVASLGDLNVTDNGIIPFVALLQPFTASVGTKKYDTLAEAGKAAVSGNATATLMILLPEGSEDCYKLAAGSTLKLGFTDKLLKELKATLGNDNDTIAQYFIDEGYVTVEPGNELTYSYPTNAEYITYSVTSHIASVISDELEPNTKYYSKFYTEGTDTKKEYALNVALGLEDSILSVPAKNTSLVSVTAKVTVKNDFIIRGFDNITFKQYGSLDVDEDTTLTIDSQNFTGKITGTDRSSRLSVWLENEDDAYEYSWDKTNKKWIPDALVPVAELWSSDHKTLKGTYPSLKQAVAAASAKDIIVLVDNEELEVSKKENGIVTIEKNLTIEMWNEDENENIFEHYISSDALNTIVVTGGATLTLKGKLYNYTGGSWVLNDNQTTASRTILIDNGTLVLSNVGVQEGDFSQYAIKATANGVLKVEAPKTDTNYAFVDGKLDLPSKPTVTITAGGYTDEKVEKLLTEGYMAIDQGDFYEVSNAGVAINTKTLVSYSSLQDAINAAKKGETIKLLKDIDTPVSISGEVGEAMALTIDLNGKKISGTAYPMIAVNKAKLTLAGTGSIESTSTADSATITVVGDVTPSTGYPYGLVVPSTVKITGGRRGIRIVRPSIQEPNFAYGVQIDLAGEIVAPTAIAVGTSDAAPAATTDNVPVYNVGGKIKGQINAWGYAKFNVNADVTFDGEASSNPNNYGATAIIANGGDINVTGGTYTSKYGPAVNMTRANGKLTISGGTFTGADVALNITAAADEAVTVSGGTFKTASTTGLGVNENIPIEEFISGGSYCSIVPAELCAVGYACEQSDPDKDKLYAVKQAWTVSFKTMMLDENDALVVNPEKLETKVMVVRNNAITEDQMEDANVFNLATPAELDGYGIDFWYDEAVGAGTKFVIGETPITKDTTLVAHFATAVAWINPDPENPDAKITYYPTLKEAFDEWKWAESEDENKVKIYKLKNGVDAGWPEGTLTYKYNKNEYNIEPSMVNIQSDNITAIVNEVAGKLNQSGTIYVGYNVTEITYTDNTFTVYPVAVAAVYGPEPDSEPIKSSTGANIANDKLEEKASLYVWAPNLVPNAIDHNVGGITVLIASDASFATSKLLQTVTDMWTDDDYHLHVDGVNKFGYFQALDRIEASVTTAAGVTSYKSSLEEALDEARKNSGSTVKLLTNIWREKVYLKDGEVIEDPERYDEADQVIDPTTPEMSGTFTLDLNGKDIWVQDRPALFVTDVELTSGASTSTAASNITITDTSSKKDGEIHYLNVDEGKSNVTVEEGWIYGIDFNSTTGTLTVNGGTILGDCAIAMNNTGKLVVNGGCIGCVKEEGAKVAEPAETTWGIWSNSACKVTINGGFVMGTETAFDMNRGATLSITGGYVGYNDDKSLEEGSKIFEGGYSFRGVVTGGYFAKLIADEHFAPGSYPTTNTDKYTKKAFPYTVSGDAVAVYNGVYVSAITEKVIEDAAGYPIQLIKDAAIVAPLVVKDDAVIDLNGHKLTAAKITAEQFAALTDEEKTAKGLKAIADSKYGIEVSENTDLAIIDTTVTESQVGVGAGTLEGTSNLLATIHVAKTGELGIWFGNVTMIGSGSAILDNGLVYLAETSGNVTSASGTAIDVVDGRLVVEGGKGAITGTIGVKYSTTKPFTAIPEDPQIVIFGGKFVGTKGAALVVDNTGKKIVTEITEGQGIVCVNGGTFTASSGMSPIQTLDDSGAVAVKPTDDESTVAYVGGFVSDLDEHGKLNETPTTLFSEPLDNDTLINGYNGHGEAGFMSTTVADTTTGLYGIATKRVVTLDGNGGKFVKTVDGKKTEVEEIEVEVPDGEKLQIEKDKTFTDRKDYIAPTLAGNDFLGWNTDAEAKTAQDMTKVKITEDTKLYAVYTKTLFTVVLDMNGGVFTEDTAYSANLYSTKGIRRTWDATAKTLTITAVPMDTVITALILEEATGTYKAEFTGATSSMVFNSWQTAAGKKVTTIDNSVADAKHVVNATAIWDPMPLILNADATTFIAKRSYSYGTELTADAVKAALFELAGVDPAAPEAGIKALIGDRVGVTLDVEDMFDPAPAAVTMTTPVTYQLKWKPVVPSAVWKPSLNLESDIGVRLYIHLPDGEAAADYSLKYEYKNTYQTIDKTVAFADVKTRDIDGVSYYNFGQILSAGSDEMTFELTATLLKKGEVVETKKYSIAGIAAEALKTAENEKLATLYRALMQYGYYAQINFETNVENLPSKDGAPALVAIPEKYKPAADPTLASLDSFQAGLALDSTVDMNVYLGQKEGYGVADFTIDEIVPEPVKDHEKSMTAPTLRNGKVFVKLQKIYADQMSDSYQISVKDKDGNSATFTRSLMNCAYALQENPAASQNLKNLLMALYQYHLAAAEYFHSQNA